MEVLYGDLVVLGPRIWHTDFLFKILHAFLSVAERVGGVGKVGRCSPERHRKVSVFFLQSLEVAGDEGDEIIDMRRFLTPLDYSQFSFFIDRIGDFAAVGKGGHTFRQAAGHGRGKKLVRRVEAREPMPSLDRFTLCPEVGVTGVVAHIRCAEVESLFRLGLVGDSELSLARRRDRLCEGDDQRAVGILPRADLGAAGNRMNR